MNSVKCNRIQWVEYSRVIAIFMVLLMHSWGPMRITAFTICFDAAVAFFFFISGYFQGNKVGSKSNIKQSAWLFASFVTWNLIEGLLFFCIKGEFLPWKNFLGLHALFMPEWIIMSDVSPWPWLAPTWFLRDLAFFILLSSLLVKIRFVISLGILILVISQFWYESSGTAFSFQSLSYYMLGLYSRNLIDLRRLPYYFNKYSRIAVYCFCAAVVYTLYNFYIFYIMHLPLHLEVSYAASLLGIFLILYGGYYLNRHMPFFLGKYFQAIASASFLIYVAHMAIYHCMEYWGEILGISPKIIQSTMPVVSTVLCLLLAKLFHLLPENLLYLLSREKK